MPNLDIRYYLVLVTVVKDIDRTFYTAEFDYVLTLIPPMQTISALGLATYSSVLRMGPASHGPFPAIYWDSWGHAGYQRTSDVVAAMNLGVVYPSHYQELADRLCNVQSILQWMEPDAQDPSGWTMPGVITAALESISFGLLQTTGRVNFEQVVYAMDIVTSCMILNGDPHPRAPVVEVSPPLMRQLAPRERSNNEDPIVIGDDA